MMSKPATKPMEPGDELSMLIGTLREADLRLEELTAGEVDSVIDSDGHPFLLQRALARLQYNELTKQMAILHALPAHIALLDDRGVILSVNTAWRRFADDNGYAGLKYGIGTNYLEICDAADGRDRDVARAVAEGIRLVLRGEATDYSVEYPCNSPTEERWFMLNVTPLEDEHQKGAVIMHLDITARRRSEDALRRFATGMDATSDAILLVDRTSMQFIYVNDAACRLHNQTREELLSVGPADVLGTSRIELEEVYDALIASGEHARPFESTRHNPDGSTVWQEVRRHAHLLGDKWTIVVLVRDITERKRAESKINQLNRVYSVLSGINTLIVRVRDREELFGKACRIAVEAGAFRMAWIGVIDPLTLDGKVVASCGCEESYLKKVSFTARDETPDSEQQASRAARQSLPVICNDIAAETSMNSVRDDLLRLGLRAVGCFPLTVAGRTEAVLALFSADPDIFDQGELRLLHELAGDISFALDHIAKEEKLHYLAYYDDLTGLANRELFLDRAAQHLHGPLKGPGGLAMFLVDIERFKNFNYSLGRPSGDVLLQHVAEWLKRYVGDSNFVARLGADQFAVFWPAVIEKENVVRALEKATEAFLLHPFYVQDAVYRVAVRVGVALSPDDGIDPDMLLKHAEAALKEAKAGGDRYVFYSHNMTVSVSNKLTLENQLREALENHEFVLHYQPKLDLVTGKLAGAEALIRWNDPRTGLVPPARFIPILEESRLIFDVGRWVLGKAIEDFLRWRAGGFGTVRIAVNVSPLQLRHRDFVNEITQAIGVESHAATGLELEITESVIMEDVKHSIASLEAIRALGVQISIDDFGTGFSSLSYLAKLPVDSLKIDRSFVIDMTAGPEGLGLISTIINLAHSLKLKVVAEGVELEEQSRLLRLLRCDEMQGFLYGKPVPREIFEAQYLMPRSAA